MIYELSNGKWIEEDELQFVVSKQDYIGGYKYYVTPKGNVVKGFYGMFVGKPPPKYEPANDEETKWIKETYINPKPEDKW